MTLFLITPAINGLLSGFMQAKNPNLVQQRKEYYQYLIMQNSIIPIIKQKRNCEYCDTLLQTEMTNCRNCGAPIR